MGYGLEEDMGAMADFHDEMNQEQSLSKKDRLALDFFNYDLDEWNTLSEQEKSNKRRIASMLNKK